MKKQYEKPRLDISWLNEKNVLTVSNEPMHPGDRWENDPFKEKN